jgi:hypothetical protein
MNEFRRNLLLSGLIGLLTCALVTAVATWLVTSATIKPPLSLPAVTLLLALIFGGFSVAEIPMMVFAMRRLVVEREGNYGVVIGLNALYVFFAAVYAIPVLLITGSVGWGLALCALAPIRLTASQMFVREP